MQQITCILLLLWLPVSLAITTQNLNNSTIALPGCPTKCGNLTVQYPFGVGLDAGCSIGPWFDINCNTSFNPPKPFLSKTNGEIINISDTKIRTKSNGIASRCYNPTGGLWNHTNVSSFNLCGYSFLGEQGSYTFHPSDVSDQNFVPRIVETVPMVIDWVIGNQTCAETQKSSQFACQENSTCVDSETGLGGYSCSCANGYEGNPYLRSGEG
ncbi:ATP binding protein [Abeliophyllum distichum]|uniref:ATP binding protein n=1 Tax=Abeliophyllum distichum TaxID=126358 RepID=A0ABD1TYH5_9LAMI